MRRHSVEAQHSGSVRPSAAARATRDGSRDARHDAYYDTSAARRPGAARFTPCRSPAGR